MKTTIEFNEDEREYAPAIINLHEIRKLKKELEERICAEVAAFHEKTGAVVSEVLLSRISNYNNTGATMHILYDVAVRVEV